jgi:hypothetical protein
VAQWVKDTREVKIDIHGRPLTQTSNRILSSTVRTVSCPKLRQIEA